MTDTVSADLPAVTKDFLHALASEGRQQVLLLFVSERELSVGEIAARLEIAQSTASQQLSLLRRGGLLTSRREGKTVYYRADVASIAARLDDLQSYLRNCCP